MWRDTFADNILYDADGTISGTYPKSSWIHNTANGTLGYFDPDACRLDTGTAGIVCDPAKVSLRVFNVYDHSGLEWTTRIRLHHKDKVREGCGAIFPL